MRQLAKREGRLQKNRGVSANFEQLNDAGPCGSSRAAFRLLAKNVNDNACIQNNRGALQTIASRPQAGARSYIKFAECLQNLRAAKLTVGASSRKTSTITRTSRITAAFSRPSRAGRKRALAPTGIAPGLVGAAGVQRLSAGGFSRGNCGPGPSVGRRRTLRTSRPR